MADLNDAPSMGTPILPTLQDKHYKDFNDKAVIDGKEVTLYSQLWVKAKPDGGKNLVLIKGNWVYNHSLESRKRHPSLAKDKWRSVPRLAIQWNLKTRYIRIDYFGRVFIRWKKKHD
jgi:hypothetical protein